MRQIIFHRQGKNVMARIINTVLEPLDNSNSRQVVFFCQDSDGKRYRVPKSEVIVTGRKPKKKARKIA